MKSSYIQFKVGFESLRLQMSYMHDTELLLNKLMHDNCYKDRDDYYVEFLNLFHEKGKRVSRAQYLYNLSIISLYGLFEQFIENQIEGYVKLIALISKKYALLPKKMQDMHCDLTLKYAQKNLDDKYVEADVKSKVHRSLVISLYQSLGDKSNDFSLVEKVYSNHTSNFRFELITTLFSNIGIDRVIQKTLSFDGFSDFYKDFFGLDDGAEHAEIINKLSEEILELVQRRNRIAHGEVEDDMLSYKFLQEKCIFFDKLCEGIYRVSERAYIYHLKEIEIINNRAFEFLIPTKLFERSSVFGFSIKNLDAEKRNRLIYEGQIVYLKSKEKEIIEKFTIESIFYNEKQCDIFETTDNFDFGIKLQGVIEIKDFKSYVFYFCA
ncbi:hypothetical protein ACI00D_001300 [Cronobacter dublinensis]